MTSSFSESKTSESWVISAINLFTPSDSVEYEEHPAKDVLQQIIENVLWLEAGYHDGSDTSCKTSLLSSSVQRKQVSKYAKDAWKNENVVDNRLRYWREFLASKGIMEEKIMQKTGKDRCQLLLNVTNEHRRKELVKRILDYAERLRPDKLNVRREGLLQLPAADPCADNLYETLPKSEKTGIPALTIIDVPKLSEKEQGLENCTLEHWNWLKSKYLTEKLLCKAEDIRRVISYFPDLADLQIVGSKLTRPEGEQVVKIIKNAIEDEESTIDFHVTEADFHELEESHEYVIKANQHVLNASIKHDTNIDFHVVFESHRYEKASQTMITLQNCGWKTIDFYWLRKKKMESKFMRGGFKNIPAFYFNKNPFRLIPGQLVKCPVMFCSKKIGIYNEMWYLLSEPSFFSAEHAFVINLFGHCREEESTINLFDEIKEDITSRTTKNMTLNLLNIVSMQAVPESAPKAPYVQFFTEKEIFSSLYPDINYNEGGIEELKALYAEANIAINCRCCREWNYDIESLKKQILSIDEAEKRKSLYFQLIDIIKRMKQTPTPPKCVYEEQKFLLVKSVIIATMDKIDDLAEKLRGLMTKTELPIEFDEVLVLDRQKKPAKMAFNVAPSIEEGGYISLLAENEMEESTRQSTALLEGEFQSSSLNVDPASVIKSESIRKKQKQLFMDSLYLQVFAHLGYAAEEIAGVIEGARNLF